jgi:hypothetical protein
MVMDTAQTPPESTQENEKKRSPWLIVIIILLFLMIVCCCIGAILCRGSARLQEYMPDDIEEILRDLPNIDPNDENFWRLIETVVPELDDPDIVPGLIENDCMGVSGEFEMQVLVGPAEVVGLEPFGIGSIPFTVEYDQGVYTVHGDGDIDYEDILEEVWGTYTVFFDMYGVVDGVCTQGDEGGILDITLNVSGEQMFVVDSAFYEEYPSSGEHEFEFIIPVVDGAMESGEGWAFILHLD